ncbi:TPA: haloacid dehalogenase-like hydrolase, partial [Enterococcus faecium]|nr:haloacid dehalogenase-like hydrolase [Enterococcus faecium]
TIKKIALASKACGADIQHIGDSLNGICLPENIFALGQAIRGYRHQIIMLGKSNYR